MAMTKKLSKSQIQAALSLIKTNFTQRAKERAAEAGVDYQPGTRQSYPEKARHLLDDLRANVSTGKIRNPDWKKKGEKKSQTVTGSGNPANASGAAYTVGAKAPERKQDNVSVTSSSAGVNPNAKKGKSGGKKPAFGPQRAKRAAAGGAPSGEGTTQVHPAEKVNQKLSAHDEGTINSFGPHWKMARHYPQHRTIVALDHEYGSAATKMRDALRGEVAKKFPGTRIIHVDHPHYKTASRVMDSGLHGLHRHLNMMAEHHPDPKVRTQNASDAEHVGKMIANKSANIRKGLMLVKAMLEGFNAKNPDVMEKSRGKEKWRAANRGKRQEGLGSNAKRQRAAFEQGVRGMHTEAVAAEGDERLNRYLQGTKGNGGIGLRAERAQPGDHTKVKLMGTKGPNVISTTVKENTGKPEGPHNQQLIHEAAHAQQTPVGRTISEYQSGLGEPGDNEHAKKIGYGTVAKPKPIGNEEETKAHHAEAAISRRAGLTPFKIPEKTNPDTQPGRAIAEARDNQRKLDLGIHRFDPATGRKVEGTSVDSKINRRALEKDPNFGKSEQVRGFLAKFKKSTAAPPAPPTPAPAPTPTPAPTAPTSEASKPTPGQSSAPTTVKQEGGSGIMRAVDRYMGIGGGQTASSSGVGG